MYQYNIKVKFVYKYIYIFTFILQENFIICNTSKAEVFFTIDLENLENETNNPFSIEWSEGVKPTFTKKYINCSLYPEYDICFKIKFKPNKPGHFVFELPITVAIKTNENQLYNKLILKGIYSLQQIKSDILEIHFVPMPLKVMSKERFMIHTSGYTKPTFIEAKVCHPEKYNGVFIKETLQVMFLNGTSIIPNSR